MWGGMIAFSVFPDLRHEMIPFLDHLPADDIFIIIFIQVNIQRVGFNETELRNGSGATAGTSVVVGSGGDGAIAGSAAEPAWAGHEALKWMGFTNCARNGAETGSRPAQGSGLPHGGNTE